MSFQSSLFPSATLDIRGFGATGQVRLTLGGSASCAVGSRSVDLSLHGSIELDLAVRGSIPTHEVGAVDTPGVAQHNWDGSIKRDDNGNIVWAVAPSHTPGVEAPVPGAWPSVSATIARRLAIGADSAARPLFELCDASELTLPPGAVVAQLESAYLAELTGAYAAYRDGFPFDTFPFFEDLASTMQDALSGRVDDALAPDWQRVKEEFHQAMVNAFVRLTDELAAVARAEIDQFGPLAEKAVAFLLLLGRNWAEVFAGLPERLVEKVRQGLSMFPDFGWLIDDLLDWSRDEAMRAFVRLVVTVRDDWPSRRSEVQGLLDSLLTRLRESAPRPAVEGFARELLTRVVDAPEIAADPARYGGLLGDLLEMAAGALGGWRVVAPVMGDILHRFQVAGADLGGLLAPIFARVRLTKSQLFDLLKYLGNDEVMKAVCLWLHAKWEEIRDAFLDGWNEIKAALDLIVGMAEQVPPELQREVDRLTTLFEWIERLPAHLFQSPSLAELPAEWNRLNGAASAGLVSSLTGPAGRSADFHRTIANYVTRDVPLMKWMREMWGALYSLIDVADDGAHTLEERAAGYEAFLYDLVRQLDDIVFAGGAGESPFTLEASYHSLETDPLEMPGAQVAPGALTMDAARAAVQSFAGILIEAAGTTAGFLEVRGNFERLRVPDPCRAALGDGPDQGRWPFHLQVPVHLLYGATGSVAVAHLAEFLVLDMRYDMPYGTVGNYKVADLDGDGVVREWEVDAVRRAAGEGKRDKRLDCDGDGEITAGDVQLAIEQQTLYLNGLMYRRVAVPIGFRVAVDPRNWAFVGFASLKDESIPGSVERVGLVTVVEGQCSLPPPYDYPLRFHFEVRDYIDRFPKLEAFPFFPPVLSPSERYDLVVRCGRDGRDLQFYFTAEPFNIFARTWTIKATGYFRGVITGAYFGVAAETGAGAAGKADLRIQVAYECGSPLAQVLEEWHDRVQDAGDKTADAIRDLRDPPQAIRHLLLALGDETRIRPMWRALRRVAGPLLDLLCDWVDPDRHFTGVLAYVRESTLRGWKPGLSWQDLESTVNSWPRSGPRDWTLAAIREVHREIGSEQDAPCLEPQAVLQRIEGVLVPFGEPAAETLARARELFGARTRFVGSYVQLATPRGLAQERLDAAGDFHSVAIRGIGERRLDDTPVLAWARNWVYDVADGQGFPPPKKKSLVKPIYQSVVQFGPGATLCSAPSSDPRYKLEDLPEQSLATVEASRLLVDPADTSFWLFVRTATRKYGWMRAGVALSEIVSTSEGPEQVTAIDPEKLEAIRPIAPLARIEASPPDTVDDLHALAKVTRAMHGTSSSSAQEIRALHAGANDFVRNWLFEGARDKIDAADPRAAQRVFGQLNNEEKAAFWAQVTADLKILFYLPRAGGELINDLVPPLMNGSYGLAWSNLVAYLERCGDFSAREATLTADRVTPALFEIVTLLIEIVVEAVQLGVKTALKGKKLFGSGGEGDDAEGNKRWDDRFDVLTNRVKSSHEIDTRDLRALYLIVAERIRRMLPAYFRRTLGLSDEEFEALSGDAPEPEGEGFHAGASGATYKGKTGETAVTGSASAVDVGSSGLKFGSASGSLKQTHGGDGSSTKDESSVRAEGSFSAFGIDTDNITIGGFSGGVSGESGERKDKDVKWEGEISLAFGDDTLTITWSVEGGGGGGAGDEAEAGAAAVATGGAKLYGAMAKIPLSLLFEGKENLVVALRFFIRLIDHGLDAAVRAQRWNEESEEERQNDITPIVLFLLSAVEALRDVTADHPQWVARILEGIKIHAQLDVNGSILFAPLVVSADVNGTVSVEASTRLATLVAPLLDFMEAGTPKVDKVTSAADRIIPRITLEVTDRVCVKLATSAAAGEIESRGVLAKGEISIPQGSAFREQMQEVWSEVYDIVQKWKEEELANLEPQAWVVKVRSILHSLDLAIQSELMAASDKGTPWTTPDPTVSTIVGTLRGEQLQESRPMSDTTRQALDAAALLRATHAHPVAIRPGELIEVTVKAGGLFDLAIYVNDADKHAIENVMIAVPDPTPDQPERTKPGHYQSPAALTPSLESVTYRAVLPAAPVEIGWNIYRDPVRNDQVTSGIAAGFDDRLSAERFAAGVNAAWLDGVAAHRFWTREAKWWTWVDTKLVPSLSGESCPLPALSIDGAELSARFTAVPHEAVKRANPPIFPESSLVSRETIWRIVLVVDGNNEDYEIIHSALPPAL